MNYLVIIDLDHEFFRKFKRAFKQHNIEQDIENYLYVGNVNGEYVVTDDEKEFFDTETISLDQWNERFPSEGLLTVLPGFYLVDLDRNSPIYKEFRHFSVDQSDEDINLKDYQYAGNTSEGWLSTDDNYDYPECDVITLEQWKFLCQPDYQTF